MGCTSLAGMSHCSSWSAPTCAGTDLVLLQWTLEAHRASSFISNCLMSLPQKNTSSALLCLNMIILSGFMWWLSHRTAVVPKLVVLRAPFTTEILELYISGFFRQMPWFQPGLIFVVVRKGQGQDTVILCHLTWLLGAGESDSFPGRRCSVRWREPSSIVCYNLLVLYMNHLFSYTLCYWYCCHLGFVFLSHCCFQQIVVNSTHDLCPLPSSWSGRGNSTWF